MQYNFPEIKTTRTLEERIQKIKDEILEFEEADSGEKKDQEAIDIIHSVETFLRGYFKGREKTMEVMIKTVLIKNTNRGYYDQDCF